MAGSDSAGRPTRLEIGRVGRAHGLRGEVLVTLTSNRPERAQPGAVMYAGDRRLVVAAIRPQRDRWVVQFEGVEDRAQAESLRNILLSGDALDAEDDAGELWVHEVIGATMVDGTGRELGRVVAVEANPAHDLLVLESGALVPVVFVREQGGGRVVVDIPDGLLDV